jgi:hypothetical protein
MNISKDLRKMALVSLGRKLTLPCLIFLLPDGCTLFAQDLTGTFCRSTYRGTSSSSSNTSSTDNSWGVALNVVAIEEGKTLAIRTNFSYDPKIKY